MTVAISQDRPFEVSLEIVQILVLCYLLVRELLASNAQKANIHDRSFEVEKVWLSFRRWLP